MINYLQVEINLINFKHLQSLCRCDPELNSLMVRKTDVTNNDIFKVYFFAKMIYLLDMVN